MFKAFIALIIMLVLVDETMRGGVGTNAALSMASHAWHNFTASLQDSIFSR